MPRVTTLRRCSSAASGGANGLAHLGLDQRQRAAGQARTGTCRGRRRGDRPPARGRAMARTASQRLRDGAPGASGATKIASTAPDGRGRRRAAARASAMSAAATDEPLVELASRRPPGAPRGRHAKPEGTPYIAGRAPLGAPRRPAAPSKVRGPRLAGSAPVLGPRSARRCAPRQTASRRTSSAVAATRGAPPACASSGCGQAGGEGRCPVRRRPGGGVARGQWGRGRGVGALTRTTAAEAQVASASGRSASSTPRRSGWSRSTVDRRAALLGQPEARAAVRAQLAPQVAGGGEQRVAGAALAARARLELADLLERVDDAPASRCRSRAARPASR